MKDPRAQLLVLVLFTAEMTHTVHPVVLGSGALLSGLFGFYRPVRKSLPAFFKTLLPSAVVYGLLAWVLQGPAAAVTAVGRFSVLVAGPWVYFQMADAQALYQTLVWLRLPPSWSFTLALSRQFLKVLSADLAEIRQNVQARGLPLDRPLRGITALPRFLLPVLVSSFRTAEQLAEALETRGLAHIPRPQVSFAWSWKDTAGTAAACVVFGLAWIYG